MLLAAPGGYAPGITLESPSTPGRASPRVDFAPRETLPSEPHDTKPPSPAHLLAPSPTSRRRVLWSVLRSRRVRRCPELSIYDCGSACGARSQDGNPHPIVCTCRRKNQGGRRARRISHAGSRAAPSDWCPAALCDALCQARKLRQRSLYPRALATRCSFRGDALRGVAGPGSTLGPRPG